MEKSAEAFRTISEVAEILETPAHVLRFWESRFPQIRPVKRAGGRRYYRPSDVALLAGIRRLLHDDGLTIRGVQKILREQGVRHVASLSGQDPGPAPEDAAAASPPAADEQAGFTFEEVPEIRGEVVPFSRQAPAGGPLRAEALRRPPAARADRPPELDLDGAGLPPAGAEGSPLEGPDTPSTYVGAQEASPDGAEPREADGMPEGDGASPALGDAATGSDPADDRAPAVEEAEEEPVAWSAPEPLLPRVDHGDQPEAAQPAAEAPPPLDDGARQPAAAGPVAVPPSAGEGLVPAGTPVQGPDDSPAAKAPNAAMRRASDTAPQREPHQIAEGEMPEGPDPAWRATPLRALPEGCLAHRREDVLALRARLLALRERLQAP
ncbi:MerR family transcriptional regulator [Rhodobacter sp. NSM]|uniref:MerR family transcriptional regulator n=1 Tax=Rhodobacter sp. NSM TaxID=3457501 RepID=UPI003FD556A0